MMDPDEQPAATEVNTGRPLAHCGAA